MNKPYITETCDETGEVTAILESKEDVLAYRRDCKGIDKVQIRHRETLEIEGAHSEYYRPYLLALTADPILQKKIAWDLFNGFPEIHSFIKRSISAKGGEQKKFSLIEMDELVTVFNTWNKIPGNVAVYAFLKQLKKSTGKPESVILDSGAIIGRSTAQKHLNEYVKREHFRKLLDESVSAHFF